MLLLLRGLIDAVDGLVKVSVLVLGILHGQDVFLQADPLMSPGFIGPAALFHQVGIAAGEQLLVFCQVGFQLFRGLHRILHRIPADQLRGGLVHQQAGGHAQLLVGGNAIEHAIVLRAFQEVLGQGFQDILAVLLQLVLQGQQFAGQDFLYIVPPVGGKDQVHGDFAVQQGLQGILSPVVPVDDMVMHMRVDQGLDIFIDRFLNPGADGLVIGVADPVNLQGIRILLGHGGGHHADGQDQHQQQGNQFTHLT